MKWSAIFGYSPELSQHLHLNSKNELKNLEATEFPFKISLFPGLNLKNIRTLH